MIKISKKSVGVQSDLITAILSRGCQTRVTLAYFPHSFPAWHK
jgi:hypothetical protein